MRDGDNVRERHRGCWQSGYKSAMARTMVTRSGSVIGGVGSRGSTLGMARDGDKVRERQ